MKLLTSPLLVFCMGLLILAGCQRAIDDMPMPVVKAETETADPCKFLGTVKESPCGLFIELENGRKIYTADAGSFELRPGAQVMLGYRLANVPAQSSNSNQTGNTNNGSYSCGPGSDMAQTASCMADQSIAQVEFTCIRDHTPGTR